MLQRNNVWIGLALGVLIPFVGYAVLLVIFEEIQAAGWLTSSNGGLIFRNRTILLMAICLNLIPFSIYQRQKKAKTMRGILSATLLYSLVWVVYFGTTIFGN